MTTDVFLSTVLSTIATDIVLLLFLFNHAKYINMLRFWNHLLNLDADRLPAKILNMEIDGNGVWGRAIEKIFRELDLDNFENRELCNLKECKSKLEEKYREEWNVLRNRKSKLRLYNDIKEEMKKEQFLQLDLTRGQRSVLSQLRCGILPIEIEIGRYSNKPVEERLCNLCKNGEVEDECHVLFSCDTYNDIRIKFVDDLELQIDDFDTKIKQIEQLKQIFMVYPRKLAKFLNKILKKRKSLLSVNATTDTLH